jgi:tetratricopeptide (TPR) repeat protein
MGNWLARIRALAAAAGLGVLLFAAAALVAPLASAADKDKKPQLSEDVAKKLRPAQEACTKSDWDTCLALAREGLAIATKVYDKELALRFMAQAQAKKEDYAGYATTVEQLNELDTVPADEKTRNAKNLASIYYQQKNFEKAEKYGKSWAETSNQADAYNLLMAIYYSQQNCAGAITAQEKAIEIDKAAGKQPAEQALKVLNACYYKTNDKVHREAVMEELLRRYPKADYFTDLLHIYQESADKLAILNVFRFGLDRDFISRESDFVEYAIDALDAGAPGEAQKVIETAIGKGAFKVIAETDRNGKLKSQAKKLSDEDRALLAGLDKEARAGKKGGEADVKVGLAYLSFGEYDKAVEAIERGLSADRIGKVKRVDDAQMMLGIAYKKLGKKDEAAKAFTAAQADPRMAKAAAVWLGSL